MTSALQLDRVRKVYEGVSPVVALDDVSLTVEPGELVAVVGRSGSGKSTLLHLAGAIERPTGGAVRIAGHETQRSRPSELAAIRARHVGFVFQQFHLVEGLTAAENVELALLYQGIARRHRSARVDDALERVGLGLRAGHLPSELSGGEQQRVAIARAIVGDPALVLADEPTGNLDSGTAVGIIELLRSFNRAGTTIVVVTHDDDLARSFDRRIELSDGSVLADVAASGQIAGMA